MLRGVKATVCAIFGGERTRGRGGRGGTAQRAANPTVIPVISQGYTPRVPLGCQVALMPFQVCQLSVGWKELT
jgi:hypothetical protein